MKPHHMTMKSILDQEETRKANRRKTSKRQRPKAKKALDLIRELD